MEQVARMNLPIVGRVQHGEKQIVDNKTKVKELGYFIAKIRNDNMNFLLNKFNEKYQKQTSLMIRFFDENPLSIRKIRYNQSGAVCYCMQGSEDGKQKISNKWQDIKCSENCKYRSIQNGCQKPACNREGTLKFLLPEISKDRIWIMKITGQESITRLEEYINFQKYLGNTMKGDYTLFLTQKEQISAEGKKYNNYVLDILKTEDFDLNNLSENKLIEDRALPLEENKEETNIPKLTSKRSKKNKLVSEEDKKTSQVEKVQEIEKQNQATDNSIKNENTNKTHYYLYETRYQNFKKRGVDTKYLIAKVVDIEDNTMEIIINPEYMAEIETCDIGTELAVEIEKFDEYIIAKKVEILRKVPKKIVA